VQLVHVRPPVPHWLSLSVGTHAPPAQHPMQFVGPHGAATQACDVGLHASPLVVQLVHDAPPVPHAREDTPETHVICPSYNVQHPLMQVLALHTGWMVPQA